MTIEDTTESNPVDEQSSKPQPTLRGRLRAILIAVGLVIAAVALGTILTLIPIFLAGGMAALTAVASVVIIILSEAGYAVVGGLYARRWLGATFPIRLPTRREVGWIAGGLVATLVCNQVLLRLAMFSGIEPADRADQSLLFGDPTVVLALVVVSVLVIGPAEELLFRGAIQRRLGRSFGLVAAIVLTSVIFVLPHVIGYTGSPLSVLVNVTVVFGVSLILCILYVRTDTLLVPILVHGLYDAVLFGATYIVMTG
jgi:membrane protease YdiL (CAAX protease family)